MAQNAQLSQSPNQKFVGSTHSRANTDTEQELTRQIPWIELENVEFRNNSSRKGQRQDLPPDVVNQQFYIGGAKSEPYRKLEFVGLRLLHFQKQETKKWTISFEKTERASEFMKKRGGSCLIIVLARSASATGVDCVWEKYNGNGICLYNERGKMVGKGKGPTSSCNSISLSLSLSYSYSDSNSLVDLSFFFAKLP